MGSIGHSALCSPILYIVNNQGSLTFKELSSNLRCVTQGGSDMTKRVFKQQITSRLPPLLDINELPGRKESANMNKKKGGAFT